MHGLPKHSTFGRGNFGTYEKVGKLKPLTELIHEIHSFFHRSSSITFYFSSHAARQTPVSSKFIHKYFSTNKNNNNSSSFKDKIGEPLRNPFKSPTKLSHIPEQGHSIATRGVRISTKQEEKGTPH